MTDSCFTSRKKKKNDKTNEGSTYCSRRVTTTSRRCVVNRRAVSAAAPASQEKSSNGDISIFLLSIPFPVPSTIPSAWLAKTSAIVLVKNLLYTRGLLPMSVEQLFSYDAIKHHTSRKNSPSLRRCIHHAQNQIHQLFQEWLGLVDNYEIISKLAFVLISLGSTYNQSQELYLLDIQGLGLSGRCTVKTNDKENIDCQQLQRLETTLTRRLLSTMMNHELSPLHEVASKASPSFRLSMTLGMVDNGQKSNGSQTVSKRESSTNLMDNFISEHQSAPILRSGFPLSVARNRNKRRCCTGINLLFQLPCQEGNSDFVEARSEEVSWMSLPTNVKGFRLPR